MTALDLAISLRLDDFDLDIAFQAGSGEVVALLGPNGAGKTTVVRALAGLEPIERGHIRLGDVVLDDPVAGIFVATEHRSVGVVFQDYLLFPRMSARDNVAFGLRARGMDRTAARRAADDWLERLGVGDLAAQRPKTLSGGQAQRVALARALATEPGLLLLDEPLAALDATTRVEVRTELRRHLATFDGVRILVTHDPTDALVLADRLVIIERGRVTQTGTPAEVAGHPASRYVADLVGINLLHGTYDGAAVTLGSGARLIVAPTGDIPVGDVAVAVRPQAVALYPEAADGSTRNTWMATITDIEIDRDRARVTVDGAVSLTAEVTVEAMRDLDLAPGRSVWVGIKAVDIAVYSR